MWASILATTGAGLIYTLGIRVSSAHWIGYQVVTGSGLGLGFQLPVIVAQATVEATGLSTVTAMILCKSIPVFQIDRPLTFSSLPNHWGQLLRIGGPVGVRKSVA